MRINDRQQTYGIIHLCFSVLFTEKKFLDFFSNSSVEGACDRLVNFVLCCLKEEKVSHPGGMEQMLMDFLGDGEGNRSFRSLVDSPSI